MRILVTGGTGFVGARSVAELVRAGHEVRLLVRSPERITPALKPFGIESIDRVVGDIRDVESIDRALRGQEAVLHAAAMFSYDVRQGKRIRETNAAGARNILGAAARRGLDPIVHVSSIVALISDDTRWISGDGPVGNPRGPYAQSKADSERVARELQASGAPIVITYPGLVLGPDPHFGEAGQLLAGILKGQLRIAPAGGGFMVDVGDVARVHAAVMAGGKVSRRYIVPGEYRSTPELVGLLGQITGRRLRVTPAPAFVLLPLGRMADLAQRVLPFRMPVGYEMIWSATRAVRADDGPAREELGVVPGPQRDVLVATIRLLLEQGRITPTQAGAVAAMDP
jgi:dihydroflavonol-4-reductase